MYLYAGNRTRTNFVREKLAPKNFSRRLDFKNKFFFRKPDFGKKKTGSERPGSREIKNSVNVEFENTSKLS